MLSVKKKFTIIKLPNILYYVRIAEAVQLRAFCGSLDQKGFAWVDECRIE